MANLNPQQFNDPLARLLAETAQEFSSAPRSAPSLRISTQPVGADIDLPSGPSTPPPTLGFHREQGDPTRPSSTATYEYRVPPKAATKYSYEPEGPSVSLRAEVHHRKGSVSYAYPASDDDSRASYGYPAGRDLDDAMAEGKPKLFGSHEIPGRSEVYSMFGTKEGRVHVGTLLGIAARDTALNHGRELSSPDDLSPHSARLVQNLQNRGALDSEAPSEVQNEYDFYANPFPSHMMAGEKIPDTEVKSGRDLMRSMLRAGRPRKPKETYEQQELL
jgi:hypothetical protein